MKPEPVLDHILKPDFQKFFIVKVEDMFQTMKLPVPPTRATIHNIIYITEGEATMSIGSEMYTISAGEGMVVAAGQVFSFANPDVNKGYLCCFHDDFIVGKFGKNDLLKDFEFLRIWGNPVIHSDNKTSFYIENLLTRMLADYSFNGMNNSDIIQSYFIALLCELNGIYQSDYVSKKSVSITISNHFRELLFQHFKTKHLVTDYASLLNITPNHLNKSVKAITGKSPIKWIMEAIVLEAKVLLFQSELTISEIAAEVGLMDQSYFSRLFKKQEGITPLEFRKSIEKS